MRNDNEETPRSEMHAKESFAGGYWITAAAWILFVGQRIYGQIIQTFPASDNNFNLLDIPITDNLTHVVQARVRYGATLTDQRGSTGGSLTLVASPGGITAKNDSATFRRSRALASADYTYARLELGRNTVLSGPMTGWDWLWAARARN